jgi:general secretion pathway protein I
MAMIQVAKARARKGITLLEVLVALAIFLLSLIAINQLVSLGADRARDVQLQSQGLQLCQSKLAEVVVGVVPIQAPQSNTPFDEDPNWQWSMDSDANTSITGLYTVTIHVSRQRPDGSRFEVALSQMIMDPSLRGSVGTTTSSSSTGTSSSSQTGSSSSTTSGSTSTSSGSVISPSGGGSATGGGSTGGSSGASKGGK